MLEVAPQPAHLQADDRVGLRVEGLVAAQRVDRDGVGLEAVGAAGHGLLDQVAEQPLAPRAGAEGPAREHARERLQDRGRRQGGAVRRPQERRAVAVQCLHMLPTCLKRHPNVAQFRPPQTVQITVD